MHTLSRLFGFLTCAALTLSAHAQPKLYHNANIYTMDPELPRAEVMLVEDGMIAGIGSEASVRGLMREQGIRVIERVDMHGRTIIPGLIDAHGHMIGLGALGLGMLDLRTARSYDDVINIIRDRASHVPAGTWIVGRGWDNESWADKRLPHHAKLSKAVPDHPVWLTRVDGHAALANAAAMGLAGVTPETPSPIGGEILRDQNGKTVGVFIDRAKGIVEEVAPDGLTGTAEECILQAQQMCLAAGLTGVHDAGVSPTDIEVYKQLEAEGRLKIRISAMVNGAEAPRYFETQGAHDGFKLSVYSAKAYVDGAMGSRGAWLLEPYADRSAGPDGQPYVGLAVNNPSTIEQLAAHALEHGYQVCTHAIGDRGNREVLDAYERALSGWSPPPLREGQTEQPGHRFRIEHAQLLHPDDIPRFAALGVIPSLQPTHCSSDMRWVDVRVGPERAKGAYAWASLAKSGSRMAFGSDFPVESHNPFLGLFAAITRQNLDEQPAGGWHPEQRITREAALRGFTIDAAYAAFWEERVGSLERAKLADFVVLDRDIMTCDVRDIADTKVLETFSFGESVYRAR
jgi:predicted amidohydrolase YtcJ